MIFHGCIDRVEVILSDWPDTGGGTTEKKSFMAVLGVIADNYCIYRASDEASKITSQSLFKIPNYHLKNCRKQLFRNQRERKCHL